MISLDGREVGIRGAGLCASSPAAPAHASGPLDPAVAREADNVDRVLGQPGGTGVAQAQLDAWVRVLVPRVHPTPLANAVALARQLGEPPPHGHEVWREVEAHDARGAGPTGRDAPRRDAAAAPEVEHLAAVRHSGAQRDERLVEGAAEGQFAVSTAVREVSSADGARRDLALERRVPAKIALLVGVEGLAVVLGHDELVAALGQLPRTTGL